MRLEIFDWSFQSYSFLRPQNCNYKEDLCANSPVTSGFSEIEPQSLGSRERQKQSLWFKQTQKDRRASDKVHDIHKYFGEINVSLVCSVCPTCHHCIGFWRFCMRFLVLAEFFCGFAVLDDFSFGFAVSNIPQCPPHLVTMFLVDYQLSRCYWLWRLVWMSLVRFVGLIECAGTL